MARFIAFVVLIAFCQYGKQVFSQQLQNGPYSEPSWPNITKKCFEAMNTTVSCPAYLQRISLENERLTPGELDTLCTSTCRNTLRGVRSNILNACKGPSDFIQFFDGVNYPATFIADQYLRTYDVACRKDPATGQFCDTLLVQWLSNTNWTKEMNCHECILGTMQTQLNSPLDYSEEFAEDFASLTFSCNSTGYTTVKPSAYALGTRSQDAPQPTSACTPTYTVKTGDTCNYVSEVNQVSTYGITNRNSLYSDCSNLAARGAICLPEKCTTYKVKSNDTCESIIKSSSNDVGGVQFLAWNPNINALCSNLNDLIDTYICLSPPGGVQRAPTPTDSGIPISRPTSPVPRPTNTFPESNGNCGKWVNITKGDTCEKVSITNGISLKDFYFLNPTIDTACSNLVLDVAYCVLAIGDITTYSGYPKTTNFITMTSNTYTTTTSTPGPEIPLPTPVDTTQLPLAPGTLGGCFAYKNYRDIPPIVDQSQNYESGLFTDYANSCGYLASTWTTTVNDLVKWNPSLDPNNCTMMAGFSYCVLQSEDYKRPAVVPYMSHCKTEVDQTKILAGTISTCSCFTDIFGKEWPDNAETCEGIVAGTNVASTNIPKWNTWIGSDCDAGLYKGLTAGDSRLVCIGVGGTQQMRFTSVGNATNGTKNSTSEGP